MPTSANTPGVTNLPTTPSLVPFSSVPIVKLHQRQRGDNTERHQWSRNSTSDEVTELQNKNEPLAPPWEFGGGTGGTLS